MATAREITGTFVRERNVFESDDGLTRTIIGEMRTAGNGSGQATITIRGIARDGELCRGLAYRLFGRWVSHWKYGDQFAFDSFVVESPATEDAVVAYLQQCRGIGPSKARKAWLLWKSTAVERLRTDATAATEIGLKPEDAAETRRRLVEMQATERAKMDLLALLNGRGIPKKALDSALADYGVIAAEVVRRNPYLLMKYRGCGFLKTDKLYLEFGHKPERLKRQALCVWHAIAAANGGDTWYPLSAARDALAESIAGSKLQLQPAMELSLRARLLSERQQSMTRWIAERRKDEAEGRVAALLDLAAEETDEDGTCWPDVSGLAGVLSDHQRQQVEAAMSGVIGVLSGSPGTGKTYTTAAVIRALMAGTGTHQVAACAPTGKAAVRLTESLARNGVTLQAKTIHSLLAVATGRDGWSFQRNETSPLDEQFVFIDESSMIDTDLMASLLRARARGTHMLFIGDPHQLAPVGHGAPLRDMIAAGIPTGELREIQRNSGRIVRACAEIRDRKRFTAAAKLDLDAGENLQLIERATADEQIDTLRQVMQRFIDASPVVYDPVWDVQVIVPINKKSSPLGRKVLNPQLQRLLNASGEGCSGSPFREGDKIINTKNGWLPAVNPSAEGAIKGQLYVANGEQAEVLQVLPSRTVVRLTAPDREIIIPRRAGGDDDDGESPGDGDESTGTGCAWELGYAISGHKAQGSEWKVAIILLDDSAGARMVQSRQWLYTSVSRAKTFCLVIGRQSTAAAACARDVLFQRKTFLRERIQELAEKRAATQAAATCREILEGVV